MCKILNVKKKSFLFLTAYAIYFSGLIIEHTTAIYSSFIKSMTSAIAIICLLFNYLKRQPSYQILKKKFFGCFILAFVTLLALLAKDFFVLVLILFVMNLPDNDDELLKNIFMISIILTVLICVTTLLLCQMKWIPNVNSARSIGAEDRWAYGFEHSQTLPLMFLYINLYYYTYKQKISTISVIVFLTTGCFLAMFFDARNGLYSLVIFYTIYFLWKFFHTVSKNFKTLVSKAVFWGSHYSCIIVAIASFLLLWLYKSGNRAAIYADHLLTGRISFPLKTFSVYPIKLINVMTFKEYRAALQSTMDSGYYYMAFRYGIIYVILLCIISYLIAKYFYTKNNICGAVSLITIAVSCAIANGFMGCYFYPFWMIAIYGIKTSDYSEHLCKQIRKIW